MELPCRTLSILIIFYIFLLNFNNISLADNTNYTINDIFEPGAYRINKENIYIIHSKYINNGSFAFGIFIYGNMTLYRGFKSNGKFEWYPILTPQSPGLAGMKILIRYSTKDIYISGEGAIFISDVGRVNKLIKSGFHAYNSHLNLDPDEYVKIIVTTTDPVLKNVTINFIIDDKSLIQTIYPIKKRDDLWITNWIKPKSYVAYIIICFTISKSTYVFVDFYKKSENRYQKSFTQIISKNLMYIILFIGILIVILWRLRKK